MPDPGRARAKGKEMKYTMSPEQMLEVTKLFGIADVIDIIEINGMIKLILNANRSINVFRSGYQAWHHGGMVHRDDGPASIWPDYDNASGPTWWLFGKEMTQEEHAQKMKEMRAA